MSQEFKCGCGRPMCEPMAVRKCEHCGTIQNTTANDIDDLRQTVAYYEAAAENMRKTTIAAERRSTDLQGKVFTLECRLRQLERALRGESEPYQFGEAWETPHDES